MSPRRLLLSGVALIAVAAPLMVYAQGLVPCGDDGQMACQFCHVAQLLENFVSWLVAFLSVVAAIMFAVAGLRLVTSAGNQSTKEAAKRMLLNTLIGFLIVLSAWLIIDFVIKALLGDENSQFGPWNTIQCVDQPDPEVQRGTYTVVNTTTRNCTTADDCAQVAAACAGDATVSGSGTSRQVTCTVLTQGRSWSQGGGRITPGGRGEAQCAPDNPNCSVEFLRSLGLTETQANIMSCVAVTENAGGAVGCSGTGPCGTFQITKTNWRNYTTGAGAEHPDCSPSNFGGNIVSAQNNGPCNARVMASMVRDVGYQPWTGAHRGQAPWNPFARGCVNTHGNATDPTPRGF